MWARGPGLDAGQSALRIWSAMVVHKRSSASHLQQELGASQSGDSCSVGARAKGLDIGSEPPKLETKALGCPKNAVPVAPSPGHVNEALLRDELQEGLEVQGLEEGVIVVAELADVTADNPGGLDQARDLDG